VIQYPKFHITLLDIIAADVRPMKLIMVVLMSMAFIGFLSVALGSPAGDISWAVQVFPAWAWVATLTFCIVLRVLGLFFWQRPVILALSVPLLAIAIWSMLFASSFVLEYGTPLAILYLVPAFVEALILARNLDDRRAYDK